MNRYQNQTRIVKILRWLRWTPYYSLLAFWATCRWILSGARIPFDEDWCQSRWNYLQHIWLCYQALAQTKMLYYYTLDEMLNDCRGQK